MERIIATEAYEYVDTQDGLDAVVADMASVDILAFDTEADSLHNYYEKTCLMQLTFAGRNVLIDPLAEVDLAPFLDTIRTKTLVMHGGDYDIRMLYATYEYQHAGEVFDTMLAGQLLGCEKLGLQALVEQYCDVVLSKGSQKTDWSRRPLSNEQITYARDDTRYLLAVAYDMQKELLDKGRLSWHQEMCQRLLMVSGAKKTGVQKQKWRVKGSKDFTREQYAYLRRLWQWREEEAQKADVPPFKIMRNEPLCALVEKATKAGAHIVIPEYIRGSRLTKMKKAIAEAEKIPRAQWPLEREKTERKRMSEEARERVAVIREQCRTIAERLAIEPSIFAPIKTVQNVVFSNARTHAELMSIDGMMHWQATLLSEAMEKE